MAKNKVSGSSWWRAKEEMDKSLVPDGANQGRAVAKIDVSWRRAANEWISNFQSAGTRRTYQSAWKSFLRWFGGHPSATAPQDVIGYRDYLLSRGVQGSTIALRLAALASFFDYARLQGLITNNPAEGVNRPRSEPYAKGRWLTTEEAQRLLQAPNRRTLEGKRDIAIMTVMLLMGLRRAEVAAMKRGDLIERGDATVELRYMPKGGMEQTRPVPAAVWNAISEYLEARGPITYSSWLWAAHDRGAGSRGGARPISGEAIRLIIARHSRVALGHSINPHALRHTCASTAWDATHDLRQVQHILGHANASSTERYLHRQQDRRGALGDEIARKLGIGYATEERGDSST